MPYNPSTGKITGAVGIHDIAKAIGAGKNEELRGHANTNMWAKYKPVSYPTVGEITLAQRQSRNFGLKFGSTYGTVTAAMTAARALGLGGLAWTYEPPTGVVPTSPLRLLDFDGYNHNALPCEKYELQSTDLYQLDTLSFRQTLGEISRDELTGNGTTAYPDISGYYPCMALLHKTDSLKFYFGTINLGTDIDVESLGITTAGDYHVCFFLSPTSLTWRSVDVSALGAYLMPYPYATLTLHDTIGINSAGSSISSALLLHLKLRMLGTQAKTFSDSWLTIDGGSTQYRPFGVGSSHSVTIPGKNSEPVESDMDIVVPASSNTYTLHLVRASKTYTVNIPVARPISR